MLPRPWPPVSSSPAGCPGGALERLGGRARAAGLARAAAAAARRAAARVPDRRGPALAAHRSRRRRADRGRPRACGRSPTTRSASTTSTSTPPPRAHPGRHTPDVLTERHRRPGARADARHRPAPGRGRRVRARAASGSPGSPGCCSGSDLHGATVGIVGMGRIGQAVARRLEGFGARGAPHGPQRRRRRSASCSSARTS